MNTPMYLKLFISSHTDDTLKEKYQKAIQKHNEKSSSSHPDAGFDVFTPISEVVNPGQNVWIDMKIKAAAFIKDEFGDLRIPVSYYMYPRSSISKTPLRLSNSVGVIDSGYRGPLMASFYNTRSEPVEIKQGTRLVQICMPDLSYDFSVKLVESLDETKRGEGGFGSTGK